MAKFVQMPDGKGGLVDVLVADAAPPPVVVGLGSATVPQNIPPVALNPPTLSRPPIQPGGFGIPLPAVEDRNAVRTPNIDALRADFIAKNPKAHLPPELARPQDPAKALQPEQTIPRTPQSPAPAAPAMPPPATLAGYTDPRWDPTERMTQTKLGLATNPETDAEYKNYFDATKEGADAQAKLEHEGLRDELHARKMVLASDEAGRAQVAIKDALHRSELTDYETKINELHKEAADMQADPRKWFKDLSGAQQAVTMIGMAIKGFGVGYTGRGEDPLVWFDRQSQASLAAQKENYERKKTQGRDAELEYARLKDKFGSEKAADLAFLVGNKQAMLSQLEVQAADKNLSETERLRAANLRKGMSAELAQTRLQLDKLKNNERTETGHEHFIPAKPIYTGGGPNPATKLDNIDPKLWIPTGPDGKGVYANSPEEATKLREKMAVRRDIDAIYEKAIKIREGISPAHPIDALKAYQELGRLQAKGVTIVNSDAGQGALTGNDKQNAIEAMGSFTAIGPGSTDRLRTVQKEYQESTQRHIESHTSGGGPRATGLVPNPKTGQYEQKVMVLPPSPSGGK